MLGSRPRIRSTPEVGDVVELMRPGTGRLNGVGFAFFFLGCILRVLFLDSLLTFYPFSL